eukprot:scaffold98718_cov39-Cyclotella_meneghiniana.AAC.3
MTLTNQPPLPLPQLYCTTFWLPSGHNLLVLTPSSMSQHHFAISVSAQAQVIVPSSLPPPLVAFGYLIQPGADNDYKA